MAPPAKRPRLWVPGIAWVSPELELQVGDHTGYAGSGERWSVSHCGHAGHITDWRHTAWIVERTALEADAVKEHALIEPHTLLDPDDQPHARRWLEEQPLLCVSGAKAKRLMAAGLRVYRVEHGVDADDHLVIEAAGGDRASWKLQGTVTDLMPPEVKELRAVGDEPPERVLFVDRLLLHLTRGKLREASVVNAMNARRLVETGYGYRGATDGTAASIDRVQRDLKALDALFGQIYDRAKPERPDARRVKIEITRAPDSAQELEIPIYGRCFRRPLREMTLHFDPNDDSTAYLIDGEPHDRLEIPEHPRWFVERVQSWEPDLPEGLAPIKGSGSVARPWMALVLVGVLIALMVLGWVLQ